MICGKLKCSLIMDTQTTRLKHTVNQIEISLLSFQTVLVINTNLCEISINNPDSRVRRPGD